VKRASFLPPRAIPAASIIALSLRSEALSAVSESSWQTSVGSSRLAKVRTSQWTALPEAAKMTAHLARGEIVALLQITHLMGGIGQLVSVNCDVSRQRVRGGRGSLDLA
jgi:hypothetical protein